MARRVFFSFKYKPDNWRASQVRNAGVVEGDRPVTDNDWEQITRGGEAAIERWINGQMSGKSCAVVLIGSTTAGQKWIKYEIEKAWNDGKGVVGVYIHKLEDSSGDQSAKGRNPFDDLKVNKTTLSEIVKAYDPLYESSKYVFNHIKENLADWVEEAISIRDKY